MTLEEIFNFLRQVPMTELEWEQVKWLIAEVERLREYIEREIELRNYR